MTVIDVVNEARERRGIPMAELARRTGIKYEGLRVSLDGRRTLTAAELVSLCKELELDMSDFEEV